MTEPAVKTPPIERILVLVRGRDDGEIVLDKAAALALHLDASILAVRVVHDDYPELSIHAIETSQALKTFLLKAEETMLEELLDPLRQRGIRIESATVWHKRDWQVALDMIREYKVGLVIKGASATHRSIGTPSDWHLLRESAVPVMLVKPTAWVDGPIVLAAIDANCNEDHELNNRVLSRASQVCESLGGHLHIITTFPSVEHWIGPVTVIVDFDRVRAEVGAETATHIDKLTASLAISPAEIHTVEGDNATIAQIAQDIGAEILVLGTHRRSGPNGILLGNTAEKILEALTCDALVVG
ncbi:MAG: universal stress protein [Pseudomonadales bacterium]|nr:universal stress protein [Pseudomonadales bacterium]